MMSMASNGQMGFHSIMLLAFPITAIARKRWHSRSRQGFQGGGAYFSCWAQEVVITYMQRTASTLRPTHLSGKKRGCIRAFHMGIYCRRRFSTYGITNFIFRRKYIIRITAQRIIQRLDFIPNTFSIGVRLNLEWVLFEHYPQIEEKREFICMPKATPVTAKQYSQ